MDIRILIAAHKPYGFAQDDIYMPVQVGAALNDKFGAACDDTGCLLYTSPSPRDRG